jgi:hypothetical protein
MVKVLGRHPDIACTNESDLGWILFQMHNGLELQGHRLDTPYSMWLTAGKWHNEIFDSRLSLQDTFYSVTLKQAHRQNAILAGDKKPCQYADPPINRFLADFEDVCFIHMVRHPAQCVGSMLKLAGQHSLCPDHYYDRQFAFEIWAKVENWVQEAKERAPTITIRLEDLLADPGQEIQRLERFLGVTDLVIPRIKQPEQYDLHAPDYVEEVVHRYGYE